MVKIGTKIHVLPSHELTRMGLEGLAGARGVAISKCNKGLWVRFPGYWKGEREWFIPNDSITLI